MAAAGEGGAPRAFTEGGLQCGGHLLLCLWGGPQSAMVPCTLRCVTSSGTSLSSVCARARCAGSHCQPWKHGQRIGASMQAASDQSACMRQACGGLAACAAPPPMCDCSANRPALARLRRLTTPPTVAEQGLEVCGEPQTPPPRVQRWGARPSPASSRSSRWRSRQRRKPGELGTPSRLAQSEVGTAPHTRAVSPPARSRSFEHSCA